MESVVLAGGRGTRLQPVVSGIPKPMADVGGRPFLVHTLDHLAEQGVERVVLAVGYRHEAIRTALGEAHRGMVLLYSVEEEPLGTGGALRRALSHVEGEDFLALNGDTLFRIPLGALVEFHRRREADLTVALKRMADCGRYGAVRTDRDGRITAFEEKRGGGSGAINGGVYVLRRRLLEEIDAPNRFSFEADVLEGMHGTHPFYGWQRDDYFIDIGVPEDYARAERELGG